MRKWYASLLQVVNGLLLFVSSVFATALLFTSKYDFDVELSIAANCYLGPMQLISNAFLLIIISLYFLTLFKSFGLVWQYAILVVAIFGLAVDVYVSTLFYDALKQNLYFYLILCTMLYSTALAAALSLYFASKMFIVRQAALSVLFFIISLLILVCMFTVPPTNMPLAYSLTSAASEPLIIESGGNCHLAPPSTSFAIMAMETMRFAPMAVISVRITADDVLVGASYRWKNIEKKEFKELRQDIIGQTWLKDDPYKIYHRMKYQTQYFNFDYEKIHAEISKYLSLQSFDSLRELFIVGMRLYIPYVLNIQSYADESMQRRVAKQLLQTLEDLGLAQPDKTSFYSIRTDSFIIYSTISEKYNFVPFVLPPLATAEHWCAQVSEQLCQAQTRFTYQNLMDIYKAKRLTKNSDAKNIFYDLTAVNSPTTYCLAKKINFIRIYTSLTNSDVTQNCLLGRYIICWIIGMATLYAAIAALLVFKLFFKKQFKSDPYS